MLSESFTNLSSLKKNERPCRLPRCTGFLWMERVSRDPVSSRIPVPDLVDIQARFPIGLLTAVPVGALTAARGRTRTQSAKSHQKACRGVLRLLCTAATPGRARTQAAG